MKASRRFGSTSDLSREAVPDLRTAPRQEMRPLREPASRTRQHRRGTGLPRLLHGAHSSLRSLRRGPPDQSPRDRGTT